MFRAFIGDTLNVFESVRMEFGHFPGTSRPSRPSPHWARTWLPRGVHRWLGQNVLQSSWREIVSFDQGKMLKKLGKPRDLHFNRSPQDSWPLLITSVAR